MQGPASFSGPSPPPPQATLPPPRQTPPSSRPHPPQVSRLVLVFGLTVVFIGTARHEFVTSIRSAQDTLCGANQAFLHQPHPDHGLPIFAEVGGVKYFACFHQVYSELVNERRLNLNNTKASDWEYLDFVDLALTELPLSKLNSYCKDHEALLQVRPSPLPRVKGEGLGRMAWWAGQGLVMDGRGFTVGDSEMKMEPQITMWKAKQCLETMDL